MQRCALRVKAAQSRFDQTMEPHEPQRFDELRDRLAAAHDTMPKRLVQAADYILTHPDEVALSTAADVARAAGVQPSTMVRLAQHLDYTGFSELQAVFRERLMRHATSYEERLAAIKTNADDATFDSTLTAGLMNAARQSLDRLATPLATEQFTAAVDRLSNAHTIYLVARRRAFPVAAHLAYGFAKLAIRHVLVSTANGTDSEILTTATAQDAAILCSFSPYTSETIAAAEQLSSAGIALIAITDTILSPLVALSDTWMEISETDYAGFRSLASSMVIASALPVALAERRSGHAAPERKPTA